MSFGEGAGDDGLSNMSPLLRKNVMSLGNRGYAGGLDSLRTTEWCEEWCEYKLAGGLRALLLVLMELPSSNPSTSFHLLPEFKRRDIDSICEGRQILCEDQKEERGEINKAD